MNRVKLRQPRICSLVLGAIVCFSLAQIPASASVLTTLISDDPGTALTCGVGNFCYVYDVFLSNRESVSSTNPFPEFGTLYDVSSTPVAILATTGALSVDFAFTSDLTDTPADKTAPTDDPSLYNLRYTLDVSGVDFSGPMDLGTFELVSATTPNLDGNYDGQAMNTSNGTEDGNVGTVTVPSSTPEPATLCLMLSALVGLGLIARCKMA